MESGLQAVSVVTVNHNAGALLIEGSVAKFVFDEFGIL